MLKYSFILIYNLILIAIFPIVLLWSFSPRGRKQKVFSRIFDRLSILNSEDHTHVLIVASSVGEVLQVISLIQRFKSLGYKTTVLYQSLSVEDYFSSKPTSLAGIFNDTQWVRMPLDFFWNYCRLKNLRAEYVVINRYEAWPNFLHCFRSSKLCFINFSLHGKSYRFPRSWPFFYIDHFFCLDQETIDEMKTKSQRCFFSKKSSITYLSNTKITSVLTRSRLERSSNKALEALFHRARSDGKKVLILGSVWPQDLDLLLPAIAGMLSTTLIVLVPHSLTNQNIQKIESILSFDTDYVNNRNTSSVIMIKEMGVLFSLYSMVDLAYVGGGFSKQVHNVLEPLIFSIPTCMGPRFDKQPDAIQAIQAGIIESIDGPDAFSLWRERFDQPVEVLERKRLCHQFFERQEKSENKFFETIGVPNLKEKCS